MLHKLKILKKALKVLIRNEYDYELYESKRILSRLGKISLESFLNTNSQIELPYTETPEISII